MFKYELKDFQTSVLDANFVDIKKDLSFERGQFEAVMSASDTSTAEHTHINRIPTENEHNGSWRVLACRHENCTQEEPE